MGIYLLSTQEAAFNPFYALFYLIVASKTWTVESLSNETVLITNLTAFWNSVEFPIIFKKRNTNHYGSLKWNWGNRQATESKCLYRLWFSHRGSRNTKSIKAQLFFTVYSGTDGKSISCNSRILSPNGKTVKTLPHWITGTHLFPCLSPSCLSLILFNMQAL
jgi:hypothetical protein